MREGLKELHIFAHLAYVLCNLPLHHLYFRSSVLEKAKQNVEGTQEKQKADYDKKHANPSVYAIGSKVLVKDFTLKKRKEGKLNFRWLGPYYIMKNIGKGSYLLQEESTLKEKKSQWCSHQTTHCLWYRRKNLRASFQKKNCRHSIYLHHQFTRLYSDRENSPMSSKPLCNSNDNSSDISSVSPIKPSPVKVPSKTTESFQCNTNDDVMFVHWHQSNPLYPLTSVQWYLSKHLPPQSPCLAATPLAVLSHQTFNTNLGMPPPSKIRTMLFRGSTRELHLQIRNRMKPMNLLKVRLLK